MVHLSTGMRIGSAAAERLGLFAKEALKTYRVYPKHVKDILQTFKDHVNSAGALLSVDQREVVMSELVEAFPRVSALLVVLAAE